MKNNIADICSGVGGFRVAYEKVFSKPNWCGHSEINNHCNKVYEHHFESEQLGPIEEIDYSKIPKLFLVMAGTSCQDFSNLNKNRKEFKEGSKSRIVIDFARLIRVKKPKYFLLENVATMSKNSRDKISKLLEVEPVLFNSAWVSPQHRNRLYWCNWSVTLPTDKNSFFHKGVFRTTKNHKFDYSREDTRKLGAALRDDSPKLKDIKNGHLGAWSSSGRGDWYESRIRIDGKTNTLTTGIGCGAGGKSFNIVNDNGRLRRLTFGECERLQQFPTGWTKMIPDRERYRTMGNAITVGVVVHLLKCLKKQI